MTDETNPGGGPPDIGELERTGAGAVVRFRRRLSHPPDKVWRALSESDHLAAWFPTTIDGDREAGAALQFRFRQSEGPAMDGEMVVFDPPRLMELQWGDERLRFELQPDAEGTVLVFSAAFAEIGKSARDGAGWHACLDLLDCTLDGRRPRWTSAQRWGQVRHLYIDRFGPEASAIGPPEQWKKVHGSEASSTGSN
ncbi:MAG: SRPBCC family protein [Acidimicrobiales bacterium]